KEHKYAAPVQHSASGSHVLFDADATAPNRQDPAHPPQDPLLPAPVERRRATAEEPRPGLDRQRMEDEERIHPPAMDRADEEVAPTLRDVLATLGPDVEPEENEDDESNDQRRQPVERAGADLGRMTQPFEALARIAAPLRNRLRIDARLL